MRCQAVPSGLALLLEDEMSQLGQGEKSSRLVLEEGTKPSHLEQLLASRSLYEYTTAEEIEIPDGESSNHLDSCYHSKHIKHVFRLIFDDFLFRRQ
jgi:hypothetical protein